MHLLERSAHFDVRLKRAPLVKGPRLFEKRHLLEEIR